MRLSPRLRTAQRLEVWPRRPGAFEHVDVIGDVEGDRLAGAVDIANEHLRPFRILEGLHGVVALRLGRLAVESHGADTAVPQDTLDDVQGADVDAEDDDLAEAVFYLFGQQPRIGRRLGFADQTPQRHDVLAVQERQAALVQRREDRRLEAGVGAQDFGDSNKPGDLKGHFYDDSYETWLETMRVFAAASFALAKPSAHAYVFCDLDRFPELRDFMSKAGWTAHRTPIVWHNPDGFRAPWPDRGPQRKYELILYAVKGDKKTTKLAGDVLMYRKDAQVGHPAQKPVELLKDLLSRSALPGDVVFDPFAGSGATLEACHALMLTCTGVEKDAGAYGVALKRIQALSAHDPGLF